MDNENNHRSIPGLIDDLQLKDKRLQQKAFNKLVDYGTRAIPYLVDALENPAAIVRINAEDIISRIGVIAQKPLWEKLKNTLENEIIIESKKCDSLKLESFLTYSINYLDEKYLKNKVVVKVLGKREELNPNHYNLLSSYFKKIDIITERQK